jgi:hypothetical protein
MSYLGVTLSSGRVTLVCKRGVKSYSLSIKPIKTKFSLRSKRKCIWQVLWSEKEKWWISIKIARKIYLKNSNR